MALGTTKASAAEAAAFGLVVVDRRSISPQQALGGLKRVTLGTCKVGDTVNVGGKPYRISQIGSEVVWAVPVAGGRAIGFAADLEVRLNNG